MAGSNITEHTFAYEDEKVDITEYASYITETLVSEDEIRVAGELGAAGAALPADGGGEDLGLRKSAKHGVRPDPCTLHPNP